MNENLKALLRGQKLNAYQLILAANEFANMEAKIESIRYTREDVEIKLCGQCNEQYIDKGRYGHCCDECYNA